MRSLTLALAALLAACSGGDPAFPDAGAGGNDASTARETLCGDGVDNDGDGLTDCADPDCAATQICNPSVCSWQGDCGHIVNEIVTDCCIGGKCRPPGPGLNDGSAITSQIMFNLNITAGANKPQSAVLRFIYPKKLDGTLLTCDDVVGQAANNTKNCVSDTTYTLLDQNTQINQVFRSVYPLNWGSCGSPCQFSNMIATVPQGQDYILYGEVWYGPRDSNNPSGKCADTYCATGQSVKAANVTYPLSFTAQ